MALVSPDGVARSRMVSVSASVNLPLHHKVQKFSSGTSSPGWPRKKGCKTAVVWWLQLSLKVCNFHLLGDMTSYHSSITTTKCCATSQKRFQLVFAVTFEFCSSGLPCHGSSRLSCVMQLTTSAVAEERHTGHMPLLTSN